MTITLSGNLEQALRERAAKLGKTPDQLVTEILRDKFQAPPTTPEAQPRDEWEARLMGIARPAATALTNEQLSRESLYTD